jgi:ribosomal protein S18 acetylase RimI-like enzyme
MTPGKETPDMQTPPIIIRRASLADNRRIATLGRQAFADSFGADNHPQDMADYLERSFGPDIQAAELAEPSSCILIADVGESPVGYARLLESPAPACIDARRPIQLQRLYAHKRWVGCGVGAALMQASIADAQQRRCDGIWLGVWGRNERAIRFYRKCGFAQVGAQPFVLGNDRQTDLILWLPWDASAKKKRSEMERFDEPA